MALAGGVTELYPSSPIAETALSTEYPAELSTIWNANTFSGLQSPWTPPNTTPSDESFAVRRLPSILKSIAWGRKMASSPRPASAETLMPRLKIVFASEGVPPELAWIAEVESSFNPSATSRSGARGLFQFMPITAKRFGLLTESGDQRTDPEPSARAAARYLSILYKRFQNWPLALAAYNAGEGRVEQLLKKHNAGSFNEIAADLPAETQEYVPKIMTTLVLRERTHLGALPSPEISPTWN